MSSGNASSTNDHIARSPRAGVSLLRTVRKTYSGFRWAKRMVAVLSQDELGKVRSEAEKSACAQSSQIINGSRHLPLHRCLVLALFREAESLIEPGETTPKGRVSGLQ